MVATYNFGSVYIVLVIKCMGGGGENRARNPKCMVGYHMHGRISHLLHGCTIQMRPNILLKLFQDARNKKFSIHIWSKVKLVY